MSSSCLPTRAALITGRDPLELGIAYDQIHPWYNAGLSPNELTIADVFRSAGYTHQREGAHDLQENGKSVYEPDQYLTHLEAREAKRFIRERDPDRPFLLYVPFTAPHSPMQAPQATIDQYESLPNTQSRRVYAAMVDELDQAIGAILGALDDEGIAENTIVLFMSDNGGSSVFGGVNTPLRGEKGQTFEGGIRVPAAIRFPKGLEAGHVMSQMTTVMDVLPTLASAAGAKIESRNPLDGQDMWPALTLGKQLPRRAPVGFVAEIPIPGLIHTALFDGPWKLVQILRETQTETKMRSFLFQIDEDPNEKNDLSGSKPEIVERMAALMYDWRRRHPMAGTRGALVRLASLASAAWKPAYASHHSSRLMKYATLCAWQEIADCIPETWLTQRHLGRTRMRWPNPIFEIAFPQPGSTSKRFGRIGEEAPRPAAEIRERTDYSRSTVAAKKAACSSDSLLHFAPPTVYRFASATRREAYGPEFPSRP